MRSAWRLRGQRYGIVHGLNSRQIAHLRRAIELVLVFGREELRRVVVLDHRSPKRLCLE